MIWHVQLQFDADTDEDARAVLATWQLSEGVAVVTVMGSQNLLSEAAVVVASDGAVSLDKAGGPSTG